MKRTSECAQLAWEYLQIQKEQDFQLSEWSAAVKQWENLPKTRAGRPRAKPAKPPRLSLRAFAKQTSYSHASLQKHLKSLRERNVPALTGMKAGQPPSLLPWEDEAIVRFVLVLSTTSDKATKSTVVEAANHSRGLRGKAPVSKNFFPRWLTKHPELMVNTAGEVVIATTTTDDTTSKFDGK